MHWIIGSDVAVVVQGASTVPTSLAATCQTAREVDRLGRPFLAYAIQATLREYRRAPASHFQRKGCAPSYLLKTGVRSQDGLGAQVMRSDQLLTLLATAVLSRWRIACRPDDWSFGATYGDVPAMSLFGCGGGPPFGVFAHVPEEWVHKYGRRLDLRRPTRRTPCGTEVAVYCAGHSTTDGRFITHRPPSHKSALKSKHAFDLVASVMRYQFENAVRRREPIAWWLDRQIRVALHVRRGDVAPFGTTAPHVGWGDNHSHHCRAVEESTFVSCLDALLREDYDDADDVAIAVVSTSGRARLPALGAYRRDVVFTADLRREHNSTYNPHVAALARDLDVIAAAHILVMSPDSEMSVLAAALMRQPKPKVYAVKSVARECAAPSDLQELLPFAQFPNPWCRPWLYGDSSKTRS